MAKKKVTRKKLLKEPDEFIAFSSRLLQFVMAHRAQVIGAVCGIVILLIIFSGIRFFSNRAEKSGSAMLDRAMSRYEKIVKKNDLLNAYQELGKDFEQILKQYPKTSAGKMATVIYADICFKADDVDKAITLYQKALDYFDEAPVLQHIILGGLAYSYQKKKAYKEAARYFERIASGPEAIMKDEALFNLGQIYGAMGEKAKKIEAFQEIISEHSDSIYIELVQEEMADLL